MPKKPKPKKAIITADEFFKRRFKRLMSYLGYLVESERELYQRPKRLDVLVTKQPNSKAQLLHIFHYFQQFNLIAYKSFNDRYSYDDVLNLIGDMTFFLRNTKEAQKENTTATLILSQRPVRLLKEYAGNDIDILEKGHYVFDVRVFKLHTLNIEEIDLKGVDGTFLLAFVKSKERIPAKIQSSKLYQRDQNLFDILQETIHHRLAYFVEDAGLPVKGSRNLWEQ